MRSRKQTKSTTADEGRDDSRRIANEKIDEASMESMDASDPPFLNPTIVGAGDGRRLTKSATDQSATREEKKGESPAAPDSSEREHCVREKAYQIWLDEGQPVGRAEAHWWIAEELIKPE